MTASGSVGIGDEWRSFAKLMKGYDRLEEEDCVFGGKGDGGKAMLAECKVGHYVCLYFRLVHSLT